MFIRCPTVTPAQTQQSTEVAAKVKRHTANQLHLGEARLLRGQSAPLGLALRDDGAQGTHTMLEGLNVYHMILFNARTAVITFQLNITVNQMNLGTLIVEVRGAGGGVGLAKNKTNIV